MGTETSKNHQQWQVGSVQIITQAVLPEINNMRAVTNVLSWIVVLSLREYSVHFEIIKPHVVKQLISNPLSQK